MVVYNGLQFLEVICSDPAVVSDILNKENRNVDKNGSSARMWEELLGKSLLFSPGDKQWRLKRKALAHAFHKDNLRSMIEGLKTILGKSMRQWD